MGVRVANVDEMKMNAAERLWWENVRRRGALWYLVNKGLLFVLLFPALGCFAMGWSWQPRLLVEGWCIGLVCGGFVWMRKELRYRLTLDLEGLVVSDRQDD